MEDTDRDVRLSCAVHGQGEVHGDVIAANIVLPATGPPLAQALVAADEAGLSRDTPPGWASFLPDPGLPGPQGDAVPAAAAEEPEPITRPFGPRPPRPQPPAPSSRRGRAPLLAAAAVAVVVLGGGAGAFWQARDQPGRAGGPGNGVAAGPERAAAGSGEPSSADPVAEGPPSSLPGTGTGTGTGAGAGPQPPACPVPEVPAAARTDPSTGPVVIAGDTAGDGCSRIGVYATEGTALVLTIEVPALGPGLRRIAVGRPGQALLLGDWNCDGVDTPAVLDAEAGTIDLFDAWGAGNATQRIPYPKGPVGGRLQVVGDDAACDHIELR